ncbi:MAG: hypothetical protein Q9171_000823 [Xanthocarpia ochracea]
MDNASSAQHSAARAGLPFRVLQHDNNQLLEALYNMWLFLRSSLGHGYLRLHWRFPGFILNQHGLDG